MFYQFVIWVIKIYIFFLIDIRITGKDNIPAKNAAILVSNHPGLFDAPLLAAIIQRRIYIYAKSAAFNTRLKRWFLKNMGGIPVRLEKFNRTFVMETGKKLNDNNLLLIFPEGKVNTDNKFEVFGLGFVKLAYKYNIPIIPITIRGTEKLLSKKHKFPKPSIVTITISHPIKYESDKFSKDEIQMEGEKIREIIQSH